MDSNRHNPRGETSLLLPVEEMPRRAAGKTIQALKWRQLKEGHFWTLWFPQHVFIQQKAKLPNLQQPLFTWDVYTKPYKILSQKEAGDPTSLTVMPPAQTTAAHFLLLNTKSSSRHGFILILTQKCPSEVSLVHSCWGSVYTCRKQTGRHCLCE